MRLQILGTLFFVLFATSARAEPFYYKKDDGSVAVTEIDLHFSESRSLNICPRTPLLQSFSDDKDGINRGRILAREPSRAETLADAAVMILTALIALTAHDTYDLSQDLRMSRLIGVLFFIFPFEAEDIYRKCGENEYLVAVTNEPKDDTLKQLKSLAEIRRLCRSESTSKPSS